MADNAKRRYRRSFAALSLFYVAALVGVNQLFVRGLLTGPVGYVAAIVPALPIVSMCVVIGRYLVEERDEFIRMLMVRQALVASGFAVSAATVWGFLDSFGLVSRVDPHWVGLLWFGGLAVGAIFNAATRGLDS